MSDYTPEDIVKYFNEWDVDSFKDTDKVMKL